MERITIVHTPKERTPNLEFVSDAQIAAMRRALQAVGWQVDEVRYNPETIAAQMAGLSPDVVFHLAYGYVDGMGQVLETQPDTTRRLEGLGLHLVGAPAAAQARAQDKLETGRCLEAAGIAVPEILDPAEADNRTVVLKPRRGACHRGVTVLSLGPSERFELPRTEEYLLQEYVDGPEFTVAVLERGQGLEVLPPVAIDFECAPDRPHIMVWEQFRWKYGFGSPHDRELAEIGRRAFAALGLRDYARFDMRVDPRRGPVILDANALPNLDPEISLLPMAARQAGLAYDDLIVGVAAAARQRATARAFDKAR
jgi:D-alanine-D-alanine ligase